MKKPKKPTATAPISEPAAFSVTEEAIRELRTSFTSSADDWTDTR